MRPVLLAAVLLFQVLTGVSPALANFVVRTESAATPPNADEPHLDPGDRQPLRLARRPIPRAVPPIAHGFGDSVPLTFACRQIVPPGLTIAYGPGADPGAAVTWHGGRPWPVVLADAIRPLGLHLAQAGSRLLIRR
jgi:hypothetical protein